MVDLASPKLQHLQQLGANRFSQGDLKGALICFEGIRVESGSDASACARCAELLALMGCYSEALTRYEEAVSLSPDNAEYEHDKGFVLERMYRMEEALACYRRAVSLNPRSHGSFNNLASSFVALGQFPEAQGAYREAIRLDPGNTTYYRNLVQSHKLSADDPALIAMRKMLQGDPALTPDDPAQLHFAYGQALEALGQHDESFEHFLKGNALHRPSVTYAERATLGLFNAIESAQHVELLRRAAAAGNATDTPVFIVGMPRSGSTLIEQILASHPQIFGAGERPLFAKVLAARVARPEGHSGRVDITALDHVPADAWTALGDDYVRQLRASIANARDYARITDKYLFNFMHVGLIHLALPNARIIHARRSPVDTCLSSYTRMFRDVPFCYDLGELGRYYRAYDTLMAHWRKSLPEGVMLDVQYEDLVENLTPNVQRLLDHCGLPWDERCLSFHSTKRNVVTASAVQVRTPLYTSSVNRWRPSRAVLQPLLDGLGPALTA